MFRLRKHSAFIRGVMNTSITWYHRPIYFSGSTILSAKVSRQSETIERSHRKHASVVTEPFSLLKNNRRFFDITG
jgi:hypothetical protein